MTDPGTELRMMPREKITRLEVEMYKREILEQSVLVSPKESAKILACSERKVYDLVRSGRLYGYSDNHGKKGLRILAAELRDYVQSMKIDQDEWRV